MSDLEDLDHEPEDLNIEEELSAPAGRTNAPGAGSPGPAGNADKGALLKVAAVLAVVVVGGAYFMKSHHARPRQAEVPHQAQPPQHAMALPSPIPPQKDNSRAGADAAAWGAPPVVVPTPPAAAVMQPENAKPSDLLPSAIPPVGQGASASSPQIVNEMPPSSAQLANAGAAAPPPAAAGIPGVPPGTTNVPGMPPVAGAPSMPSTPPAALPEGFPPATAGTPGSNAFPPAQPSPQPPAPAVGMSGQPMPSVPVSGVDKTDLNKPEANNAAPVNPANPGNPFDAAGPVANAATAAPNAMNAPPAENAITAPAVPKTAELNNAAPASPATETADQAKIEQLQKKIDDLQKTISQLQQGAVVKEDMAEKEAGPQKRASSGRSRAKTPSHKHANHVAISRWVLRAAKPGVAWVAKKGSDDLRMVETGDSLSGVGTIEEITQDSSGAWVVRGNRGRISQ